MIYTGIGARKTPDDILHKFCLYGNVLGRLGYVLRSGAADGADTAFEKGCVSVGGPKEIYLPWKDFNDNPSSLHNISYFALELAEDVYGPKWEYLSDGAKKLMARNCYQVLGENLDLSSDFVLCWTPDGCRSESERTRATGGTGQAIALADRYDIPIFNFAVEGEDDRLLEFLENN